MNFLLSVFFISFCNLCLSSEIKEDNGVLILTKENFDDVIKNNEFVLVKFYAPWCGHCKALAPEYEHAASKLKEDKSVIKFAKVDATVETELATRFEIRGYPTLKFFKNQKSLDYNGKREASSLINWCKKKIDASMLKVNTVDEVNTLADSNDMVVIAFLKDSDSTSLKSIESVADQMSDVVFAVADSPKLATDMNVAKIPSVVVLKKFDDRRSDYTEDSFDNLPDFIRVESVPLVTEFTQESAPVVFGSPIHKHILAFLSRSTQYDTYIDDITKVAKKFKGKVHVVFVDVDNQENERILQFVGLSASDAPTYSVIELGDEALKFKPSNPVISFDEMSTFVQDYLSGNVKRHMMSEEVPTDVTGNLVVLVGKNYNEVCKDKTKAVFVKLYAPWCGHCKKLAPIWDELADAFRDSEDIIIAKMDSTTNEAEGLRVASFPTLKYYAKGSSEPIEYYGDRSLESLKKFVESGGKSITKSREDEDDHAKDEL